MNWEKAMTKNESKNWGLSVAFLQQSWFLFSPWNIVELKLRAVFDNFGISSPLPSFPPPDITDKAILLASIQNMFWNKA